MSIVEETAGAAAGGELERRAPLAGARNGQMVSRETLDSRGTVFDVQRFSVRDGPGIRTTVFLKGCPLRCLWCETPEGLSPRPEVAYYSDRCEHDFYCMDVCPRPVGGVPAFLAARDACTACGECVHACPTGALAVAGTDCSARELVALIARDRMIFAHSGGGVTISGGEPTLQLPFAAALARACHDAGLSVGLQTCGEFSWSEFAPQARLFDFIQLDLKAMDADLHRQLTGTDNATILWNTRRLAASGAPVELRMVVVPGHNDGEDNLRATAKLLHEIGIPRIDLRELSLVGERKCEVFGFPRPPFRLPPGVDATVARLRAARRLRQLGITIVAGSRRRAVESAVVAE
ncbi:MAG: glycyl-radical enzyme activating protein [Candidatus Schekmanbacteria bacterium]|nr:glycyl-radical enzyme activating protein [Candidatus Schekmanbacteria bacterium]